MRYLLYEPVRSLDVHTVWGVGPDNEPSGTFCRDGQRHVPPRRGSVGSPQRGLFVPPPPFA